MQKWEYLVVSALAPYPDRDTEVDEINGVKLSKSEKRKFFPYLQQLGKEGLEFMWEKNSIYFFKRPIE